MCITFLSLQIDFNRSIVNLTILIINNTYEISKTMVKQK